MTAQEDFWKGTFGDEYTNRNKGASYDKSQLIFWANIYRKININSAVELGCNRGNNLKALRTIDPHLRLKGIEINQTAVAASQASGFEVMNDSITRENLLSKSGPSNLSFVFGVLIHINPDLLAQAYKNLYEISDNYILISEYFSTSPQALDYRGETGKLWKRDFAGEFWKQYPDCKLVDYGFVWRYDPNAPIDDVNWFLFQKDSKL